MVAMEVADQDVVDRVGVNPMLLHRHERCRAAIDEPSRAERLHEDARLEAAAATERVAATEKGDGQREHRSPNFPRRPTASPSAAANRASKTVADLNARFGGCNVSPSLAAAYERRS